MTGRYSHTKTLIRVLTTSNRYSVNGILESIKKWVLIRAANLWKTRFWQLHSVAIRLSSVPGPEMLCVYQFKVVLRGISPMIWRRLLLRSDHSIADHSDRHGLE
jgi:hypothetical protein